MCGIAGYAGNTESGPTADRVRVMVTDLARRGPDAEGLEIWDGVVLGHRRLSIFDLSQDGRQPMYSEDRAVAVVFNGAVYNFRELRAELEKDGYRFRSNTDTEVLIHGYREWGIDRLVGRMRGMFALGLWDDRTRRLFLIRDRLGVKPLIYAHLPNGDLAFASTVRALQAAGVAGEIDAQAVTEFLEYGYVTDGRTIYQETKKVPAAHILEWSNGAIRLREYWNPSEPRTSGAPGFEEAVEETERLFLEAVRLRLNADVPVGALLSGGVDSSLVCWAIAHLGADITAFTVGTPGDPWDETEDAVATARKLGIRHQVIEISPEDSPLNELTAAYGEPFACASALGMLSVSRAIKPSATVLLTGDGGDDVFLGYPGHRHYWQAEKIAGRIPRPLARAWYGLRKLPSSIGSLKRPVHFLDYVTGGIGAVAAAKDGLPFYKRNGMLGERLIGARLPEREVRWSPESGRSVLKDFLHYEHTHRFTGEYMTKVDGATMHYALEARSPLLDQEIWKFASSLPFDVRLHRGQLKAILRELTRRKIGERVASGRKRGFGIPVNRWIAGRWKGAVEEVFRDSWLAREGWLQSEGILRELKRAAGQGWATDHLWYAFVLESWIRARKDRVTAAGEVSHSRA
ncbi:MAG: asparagine synthase (glutamine-hydrolyzing) [Bryobacteraceae bacterium]